MLRIAPSFILSHGNDMNALWLTRMSAYKNSPLALESAKALIGKKIDRESALLARYHRQPATIRVASAISLQEVLLAEARAARHFWREFGALLPRGLAFSGRVIHGSDPVNRILDIGYHHLTGLVAKTLAKCGITPELGLLHVAHAATSAPLAYDLVELFRADIVDAEALRFFRLKKRVPPEIRPDDVARFIARANKRLDRRHYLRAFKGCRSYRYYMELQILKFERAVDRGEAFAPADLPTRHDARCLTCAR
jgi:CRISPR-associated endonuclease Cas1